MYSVGQTNIAMFLTDLHSLYKAVRFKGIHQSQELLMSLIGFVLYSSLHN